MYKIIKKWADENCIEISDAQHKKFEEYKNHVLTVNQHMNLTAITETTDFAIKHIIDSLSLLPFVENDASLIDIGTGAGFPGVVLKIMRENMPLSLLDSLRKRIIFLRETADMLKLQSVECIHARAEDWAKTHAEAYDICTARAVARLDKLAGYALPLIKKGGLFLAMKGRGTTEETTHAQTALKNFGGEIEGIYPTKISEEITHSVIVIRKL